MRRFLGSKKIPLSRMNDVDQLFTAMLTIVFAAVMLVAGGLYIDTRPVPTVPAAHVASVPLPD